MTTGTWRDRIQVETGDWVSVHGVEGRVCGLTGEKEYGGASRIEVCFRPHAFHGFAMVDHRDFTAPFLGISVLGKLNPEPFKPWGQETRVNPTFAPFLAASGQKNDPQNPHQSPKGEE